MRSAPADPASPATAPATALALLGRAARQPLLRNGYALVASAGTSAVLGMAFWVVAARTWPAGTVGVGSALVAAMTLLSTLAQLNLSNVLNRFLPVAGARSGRLVLTCYSVSFGVALLVGAGFVLGTGWWAPSLAFLSDDRVLGLWFVTAVALWGLFVLQDGALAGLRHSGWVLGKNAVFGAVKLGVLLVPLVLVSDQGIFLAWTLPLLPMLLAVHLVMARRLLPGHVARTQAHPGRGRVTAHSVARFASADYLVALAGTGLTSALPILVLEVSGAEQAAYFAVAWNIFYSLYLVSRSMATSLLVEGATDTGRLADLSYRTLVHTVGMLAPAVVLIWLLAPQLLAFFGPDYAEDGTPMLRLLALSAIPAAVVVVYGAVERVRARMRRFVLATLAINLAAVVLIWAGLQRAGITGLGLGWLAAQSVAAAVLLATVLGPLWVSRVRLSGLGWLVRPARRMRARVHRQRDHRLLTRDLGELAGVLGLPAGWRIQRVMSTVGDVTVASVGPGHPAMVLKCSRTPRGDVALTQARDAVALLARDTRLAEWDLLPVVRASGRSAAGRVVLVEEFVPGRSLGDLLEERPSPGLGQGSGGLLDLVTDAVRPLHERTSVPVLIDDDVLAGWVDVPLRRLQEWAGLDTDGALAEARAAIGHGLAGRSLRRGWLHGDLAPGNVLLDPTGTRVRALLDWERATADGPVEVDLCHLWLTARMQVERRELGALVTQVIGRGQPDAAYDPALVLLTWLHHVSGIVDKTGSYAPGGIWAIRNVHAVLRRLERSPLTTGDGGSGWPR
ncbi:MAG TPA: phosphotransferase [Nocardioidaceae bacterium]|nr:phosphotransferase [Nocardioidaceae bacterium]